MEFRNSLSLEDARGIDLVDYLQKLGHQPTKIRLFDYWYLSPLRDEKTASFKVNRKLNRWYDHGIGEGGNFIDSALRYYNCTIPVLLHKLKATRMVNLIDCVPVSAEISLMQYLLS